MNALLCTALAVALAAPVPEGPAASEAPAPRQIQYGGGRGLVLGGTILVVAAVAAYGVTGAGLALGRNSDDRLRTQLGADDIDLRRKTLRRGRAGNIMAIVGGISALTFMATGISLISVGRRRARAGSVSLVPLRRGAGVAWSLLF